MLRVIGISNDVTLCFHCGKRNLKKTVAIHNDVTNETYYYGTECASSILSWDKKDVAKTAAKSSKNDTFLFKIKEM